MAEGRLVPNIKDNDWPSVRQALKTIAGSTGLGPGSTPSFGSVSLDNLIKNRILFGDSTKTVSSISNLTV